MYGLTNNTLCKVWILASPSHPKDNKWLELIYGCSLWQCMLSAFPPKFHLASFSHLWDLFSTWGIWVCKSWCNSSMSPAHLHGGLCNTPVHLPKQLQNTACAHIHISILLYLFSQTQTHTNKEFAFALLLSFPAPSHLVLYIILPL